MAAGISVLILSGICQGSFGLGYKKYNPLSWEAFWCIYSLFCMVVSAAWTIIVEPDVFSIIAQSNKISFILPFLCGMAWGVSTIAFSKSVLMIGMSLCFGVNMGVSSVVGTVVPFFTQKGSPSMQSSLYLAAGVIITLIGISVITKAGLMKENGAARSKMMTGVLLAVVSGLCSGIMNIGFDKASAMGELASGNTAASAVQWFPVLVGGMIASAACCFVLLIKNRTFGSFVSEGAVSRIVKLFLTSIVWFFALALYGISSKMIGSYGSSIGWLIFNAIALIVSNIWGLITGEWKNAQRAKRLLFAGDIILILSWLFIMNV